jgi:hypothetical protein
MHPRLKKIIFNKLYEDLKNAEIIHFEDSIWFIDREKKYWYLEYEKNGRLFWRYQFFNNFFLLFSMERSEYERVIADWVEEVLNSRVNTTDLTYKNTHAKVEEVLNSRVNTTWKSLREVNWLVEEVLNSRVRVKTTFSNSVMYPITEEEVLNFKVDTTKKKGNLLLNWVEKVLNSFRVN